MKFILEEKKDDIKRITLSLIKIEDEVILVGTNAQGKSWHICYFANGMLYRSFGIPEDFGLAILDGQIKLGT